ncbi:MAG: type II toxin-antitoxin system VapC family toxin [Burkholderiales bacterium]|jgi:predicted nucleic acid-binding protein|nr:type II toxin-antitoxin system VapC family toxin [Burkholderiales bacterium]
MIVVDVNVVAYLYLPGPFSAAAENLLLSNSEWASPRLWRSEFRNILATYMRKNLLSLEQANTIFTSANDLLSNNEYEVSTLQVLQLAHDSGCSAYDCEYVALAHHLKLPIFTADKALLKAFPEVAVALSPSN